MALPAGASVPVVKPLPRFPVRAPDGAARLLGGAAGAEARRDALPHDLLLVDVKELVVQQGSAPSTASAGSSGGGGEPGGGGGEPGAGGGSAVPAGGQLYCVVRLEGGAQADTQGEGGLYD